MWLHQALVSLVGSAAPASGTAAKAVAIRMERTGVLELIVQ